MINQASSCDLKELVRKFIPESIGKEIEKATTGIYPLQNVFIRKVKILKAPKFDLGKLMEVRLSPSLSPYIFSVHNIKPVNKLHAGAFELVSSLAISNFCKLKTLCNEGCPRVN